MFFVYFGGATLVAQDRLCCVWRYDWSRTSEKLLGGATL